jgi:hypothetical protein
MSTRNAFLISLGIIGLLTGVAALFAPVAPVPSETASSTALIVLPPEPARARAPAPAASSPQVADEVALTSTPVEAPKPKPVVKVIQPLTPPPAAPVAPALSQAEVQSTLDQASHTLQAALINIICVTRRSGLHSISGSGVIIDPKGYILTNAHIAQFFLLEGDATCRVRTGSPAVDRYSAKLAYLSPRWVEANAALLGDPSPTGTGEHDFALLGITGSLTAAPLPSTFPAVPLSATSLEVGAPVVIGSYGAQFLSYGEIISTLFPTLVFGSVKKLYTFHERTVDVLSLGGSVAAQEGSSGGGVVGTDGLLSGLITTSTNQGATDTRDLNAVTAPYLRGAYLNESGETLEVLLARAPSDAIRNFAPTASQLASVLTAKLP